MTQEILDYLLIRSLLFNSEPEELIDATSNRENFIYVLDNIYILMQNENFIFMSPNIITNVVELIQKYRFDYNKDKEMNDKMNYIIGRFNDYRNMSEKRKRDIVSRWVQEESENRNLPFCYRTLPNLLGLISLDTAYFQSMISSDESFEVGYVVEYLSLINIIINKYPKCFSEDMDFLAVTRMNLIALQNNKKVFSRTDYNMLKKTIKKMKEEYSLPKLDNSQKVKKKTEN